MKDILMTSTHVLQGYEIVEYLGMVTAEAFAGTSVISDIFASFSDVLGGTSKSYNKELKNLRKIAIDSIYEEAKLLNANAVVGINFDYNEISGQGKQMFMITITGTAVIIKSNLELMLEDIIDEYATRNTIENFDFKCIKINRLLKSLKDQFMSIKLQLNLLTFYEICGEYGKTEDILYELIDNKYLDLEQFTSIVKLGIKFYERLLTKEDDDLLEGNLPRDEVIEGMALLKERI